MAYLPEITVVDADLIIEKGDIANYLFDQADFTNQIADGKRIVYYLIKKHYQGLETGKTEAQIVADLLLVKDKSENLLKKKIVLTTIALIMRANEMLDMFREYDQYAKSIQLDYYVDLDEDSVISSSEELITPRATFGR